jgi:hypothetical protein
MTNGDKAGDKQPSDGPTKDPAAPPAEASPSKQAKPKASEAPVNVFIRNETYPDAQAIFQFQPKSLNEIKGDCVVVLDTNTLLVPYDVGQASLAEIEKTYQLLVKDGRLVVPGQVAREFADERVSKLKNLFQQLTDKKSAAKLQTGDYPLLQGLEAYKSALQIETEIAPRLEEYRKQISAILEHVSNWTWNDPVSSLYSKLFNNACVVDIPIEREKVSAELLERNERKHLPGYKDANNPTGGIGDLLIWKTILRLAEDRQQSLIFVSADGKADWRVRSANKALYPNFELVEAYRRTSNGQTFHIIDLAGLLKLFGASDEVVREVKQTEARSITVQWPTGPIPWIPPLDTAQIAVATWVEDTQPGLRYIGEAADDTSILVLRRDDGTYTRLYVAVTYARAHIETIREMIGRAKSDLEAGIADHFVVAAACPSKEVADDLLASFYEITFHVPDGCVVILGHLDPSQIFVVRAMHQRRGGKQTFHQ